MSSPSIRTDPRILGELRRMARESPDSCYTVRGLFRAGFGDSMAAVRATLDRLEDSGDAVISNPGKRLWMVSDRWREVP